MDWDMLQKTCLAFQVIYESNPFEYSTLCVVTNSDEHWIFGSKIPLNAGPPAFGKLWSVGFYLGPGKVMIQSSRPSSTFSTAGWRHLGGGGGQENLIIDWLTDAVSWLQSTQPSFVVLFNSQLANFAPPTPIVQPWHNVKCPNYFVQRIHNSNMVALVFALNTIAIDSYRWS